MQENKNTLQLDPERLTPEEFYSKSESKINMELVLSGVKNYRRQEAIGPYFADFFFPDNKLILEIDGPHHKEQDQYGHDRDRDKYMNENGYCVVRATVEMVDQNASGILSSIRHLKGPDTYFINDESAIKSLILKAVEVETEKCPTCSGTGIITKH